MCSSPTGEQRSLKVAQSVLIYEETVSFPQLLEVCSFPIVEQISKKLLKVEFLTYSCLKYVHRRSVSNKTKSCSNCAHPWERSFTLTGVLIADWWAMKQKITQSILIREERISRSYSCSKCAHRRPMSNEAKVTQSGWATRRWASKQKCV